MIGLERSLTDTTPVWTVLFGVADLILLDISLLKYAQHGFYLVPTAILEKETNYGALIFSFPFFFLSLQQFF